MLLHGADNVYMKAYAACTNLFRRTVRVMGLPSEGVAVEHQFLLRTIPKIGFQMKHTLIINKSFKIISEWWPEHWVQNVNTRKNHKHMKMNVTL